MIISHVSTIASSVTESHLLIQHSSFLDSSHFYWRIANPAISCTGKTTQDPGHALMNTDERTWKALSRKDRNPYPRPIPPSLLCVSVKISKTTAGKISLPSTFSSSLASSTAAPADAPAAGPEAAAAPPPDPTFRRRSLTSLPSSACIPSQSHCRPGVLQRFVRTLAKREVQIGSTSAIFAAVMRV
jgi:hypothetical protein